MKLSAPLTITDLPFDRTWYGRNCKMILGTLTVFTGFEWDGLSYARDGKRDSEGKPLTWKASCLHDVLYEEQGCPLTRRQVDKLFYRELKKNNFKGAYLYYFGVRLFGWMFWRS